MKLSNIFAKRLADWNSEVEAIENGKECTRHHKMVSYVSAVFYSELYKAAEARGM